MKRKSLSILSLLVCMLLLTALCACGTNTADAGSAAASASAAAPASQAASAGSESEPAEGAASAAAGIPASDLKVALVLNGSITDASWNANGYDALVAAQEDMGFELAYIENVQTADMEATFRDYAEQGYQLILGHGSQFQDAILTVAPNYPNAYFFVFNGEVSQEPNVASYRTAADENTFLAGALAAMMTQTGKVGCIGATEVPTTTEPMEGFMAGARYVNPDIEISSAYVGSYNDTAKAKELAKTMFEQGVDIIQSNANQGTAGLVEAAQEYGNGVMLIGNTTDQYELSPEHFLTSNLTSYKNMYALVIENVINGTFQPEVRTLGLAAGGVDLAPYHEFEDAVTDEIRAELETIRQDIMDGKLNDVLPCSYSDRG